MRVLVVTKMYPNVAEPLSAPFNRQQITALARRCPVEVLATIPWFPGAARLSSWRASGSVPIPAREVIEGVEVAHPRTPYVPRVGHPLSAGLYAAAVWPAVRARRDRFDVLMGSWAYPDGVAAVMLGKSAGLPVVVKVHGSDLDVLGERPSLRWQMSQFLPRADRIVAVSRSLADRAAALGVDPARIDLVMNGVDTDLFHPRDRAEARQALGHGGDRRRWIVCVARLRPEKGVLDLAAAFATLARGRDDVAVVFVGDGPARAQIEEAARPLGDRVILAGSQPLPQVPIWMAAADLVTLPSHHEGTPNVLLEALACGRRVVATNVGGIPDVVHAPALGALVPPSDPTSLAAALTEALATPYDPAAVAELGARGGWADSAANLAASLERAVDEHRARRGLAPLAAAPAQPAGAWRPPPRVNSVLTRARQQVGDVLPRSLLIRRGARDRRRIALTFDDGPDAMTDAYLDVLGRHGARATFFLVGEACARFPDAVARIAARGHELGGHGFTHTVFPSLDAPALKSELERTDALLTPAPGGGRRLVRPPRGATSPLSLLRCARAGYVTVLWSVDSDDCRTDRADDVVAALSPDAVSPGDIVLLHEGQTWTLDALPRVIDRLRDAGFELVTVSEMAAG
jgi:peptidoglycan/xylan/chitin deacetylase (PgdA/CDA1 family)/glycosyltransferase involved in cell wall biosynthesis